MEKIAILRRNGLGDLLCSFPMILFLQREKKAEVTLFIDSRNAPLIPYLPPVHKVIILPKEGHKYWNLLRTAWPYRGQFSLALSAKTSPMKLSNWFLFCLGAKKRVAYVKNGKKSFLINAPLSFNFLDSLERHQALKTLQMVNPEIKEVPEELYPKLIIPDSIRQQNPLSYSKKGPVILISATTTKKVCRLNPERYAKLLNRLYAEMPFTVLLVGQKEDHKRAHEIAFHLQMEHTVHFPRNFDDFMLWLDLADLFFVGDGGVAHIGAALGKHVLVLMGETKPQEWKPLGRKVEALHNLFHVDLMEDEEIFKLLKQKMSEVVSSGRDHL